MTLAYIAVGHYNYLVLTSVRLDMCQRVQMLILQSIRKSYRYHSDDFFPITLPSHYPRHTVLLFIRFSPLLCALSAERSKSPERELVSQSALCIRRFETRGRRIARESRRARDVTSAVVTISIPRFEPSRIADCGWFRDESNIRIQTGMNTVSGER